MCCFRPCPWATDQTSPILEERKDDYGSRGNAGLKDINILNQSAGPNPKYFGTGRGITLVNYTSGHKEQKVTSPLSFISYTSPQMMQPVDFLPFTSPLGQQKPPPFIHIDESDSLLNMSFVDGPGRVNQLSLYTVLLHELGHVMQYLESASPFSQGKDVEEITVKSLPTIPANLILQTQKALENQDPRASIWPQLTDFNRVVQVWLTVVEDALTQNDLLGRVDKAKKIGEKISAQAQVWLEHDVTTNVEHPEAQNRGEAIRHIHGAEAKVEDPNLKHFDMAKKSIQDLSAKNIQSDPKSFPDLHRLMYGNAFLLTQHLPDLLKEFLGLVEIHKST